MHSAPLPYIDPNTGGMLFQILAIIFGLFSGILLFFSSRIRQFIARIRRNRNENQPPPSNDPEKKEE